MVISIVTAYRQIARHSLRTRDTKDITFTKGDARRVTKDSNRAFMVRYSVSAVYSSGYYS